MSDKKIIVVFGATGLQGGSVAKALLNDPKTKAAWTVRGVTRNVSKPSAKALESQGAETVAADLNDPASLKKALAGAYAVFAVTNYWETGSAETEIKQGKAIADAAKEAGIQHFIWSSLPNVTEMSKGELTDVKHFDSKAAIEAYIREIEIPASFYLPGFYMSNLPGKMFRPLPPNNDWTIALPIPAVSPVPLLATGEDTGKYVKGILLHREQALGKRIYGATDYYTLNDIVNQFKELYPEAGKTAKTMQPPAQIFEGILVSAGQPEEAAHELTQNMLLMGNVGYYGGADIKDGHELLVDELTTWKDFMRASPAFADLK